MISVGDSSTRQFIPISPEPSERKNPEGAGLDRKRFEDGVHARPARVDIHHFRSSRTRAARISAATSLSSPTTRSAYLRVGSRKSWCIGLTVS